MSVPDGAKPLPPISFEDVGPAESAPILALAGGPGCANYLVEPLQRLLPEHRLILPDPRGTGSSEVPAGLPVDAYSLAQAIADLEKLRCQLRAEQWTVLGHSWGGDLALAYALTHPERVLHLVSLAATGIQNDRGWKAAYDAGKERERALVSKYAVNTEAQSRLISDWRLYIQREDLLLDISRLPMPVSIIGMQDDIRPDWPLRQLAALAPQGRFYQVSGAGHYGWQTNEAGLGEVLATVLQRL